MAGIKGLDNVLKNLSKFGDEVLDLVIEVTDANVKEIVAEAKRRAPVDKGNLQQSIYGNVIKSKKHLLLYEIGVGGAATKYAPYVEFGTGTKVDLSLLKKAGFPNSFAAKFKGKGIKKVNIQPQPYFFPAYLNGRRKYVKDLNNELKHLVSKYG